jgi:PGAP1-like protein
MAKKTRNPIADLRGAARLVIEATKGVTDIVEAMQIEVGSGPAVLGRPLEGPTRALLAPVYRGIRAMMTLVGGGLDVALARFAQLPGESGTWAEYEAVLAALNGVLGDYLSKTKNPLAIEMGVRQGGRSLVLEKDHLRAAFPRAGGSLLVLVHGSCLNDLEWSRHGHDHGVALARDRGYAPAYLHYNTGLHISTNGRALAAILEQLVAEWPVPLEEVVILAHSMGGLVSRSACHYAEVAGHAWPRKLRKLVCLGSPHNGAPFERGGHWVDVLLGASRHAAPLARLGQIRSAGVTDMRFGNVLDDDWEGRDRFGHDGDRRTPLPLPAGVDCYAIAATSTTSGTAPGVALASDGLVPVDSALGRNDKPELSLRFPDSHQWIAFGAAHLDLLDRADVYAKIASWL